MTSQDTLNEMLRIRDEALGLCDKAAELGQAIVALCEQETGQAPVPRTSHRRPRPSYLTAVKGLIGGGMAAFWMRHLARNATLTGAAAIATTAAVSLMMVPSGIPAATTPQPGRVPQVQVAAGSHARRRTEPASVPVSTPATSAGEAQSSPGLLSQVLSPSPGVSVSVTPGGTSTVQVTVPAPVPTVSACLPPLLLIGELCLAA